MKIAPITRMFLRLVLAILTAGVAAYYFATKESIDTGKLQRNVVDLHIHTMCVEPDTSPCYISPAYRNSFKAKVLEQGFRSIVNQGESKGVTFSASIARAIRESKYVSKGVILALDGVVTNGKLDLSKTQLYIPNKLVAKDAKAHPELLFGASINPERHDWQERLDEAVQQGAQLIKWLPSIQLFDPADVKHTAFYKEMARLKLPLLTHTGDEEAFIESNNIWTHPQRLRLPLSLGVTVIAAHAGVPGKSADESYTDSLAKLTKEFPNLYLDISSLSQINKIPYWDQVFSNKSIEGRLVQGSDFPLIATLLVSPFHSPHKLSLGQIKSIQSQDNIFDRGVMYKVALGVPPRVFNKGRSLLRAFR